MKKFYLSITFLCCVCGISLAQIITPIIKANFGVEADLRTNYFNNFNQPGNDDWFANGLAGSGNFVIDTTGAAAIVGGYTTNPGSRMTPFSRFMRVAPYTTVNNRIWLDAIFHRDYHGTDSTVFGAGSNKNAMSPANWTAPQAQNIPDKNDILDAMLHIRRAGPNLTDSLWMFGGISIENTTGNRYFDFELYQTDIRFNRATLSFLGYGPDLGHTSWKFDAAGNILKSGDIILSAEYGSSSLTLLEARVWINKNDLLMTPTAFTWGGSFDGASSGSQYGYASIVPKTAGAFYTGLQSGNNTWTGAFSLVRQDNTVVTNYTAKQFMEFSVNLSKLGLDPGRFGIDPCGSPFRRVLIKSRASTSFTAELKDFISPFSLFNYEEVKAHSYILYYCGTMPTTTIYVSNPNPDLIYKWWTNNGNIVGTNTGVSINVNAPGTYYVSQQFDTLCPEHSRDSVTIMFDAICVVLDVNLVKFSSEQARNKNVILNWQATNNQLADSYELEYSTDGSTYQKLISYSSNADSGTVSYNFEHYVAGIKSPVINYRIKITGKTGQVKYSNIILQRLGNKPVNIPELYPNPASVSGKTFVAISSDTNDEATVTIKDIYGRTISIKKYNIKTGENTLLLTDINKLNPAMYIIQVKTSQVDYSQKVVIKN